MSRQTDLAWLAGFTDGDGYFGFSRYSNGKAVVFAISQNGDKKILQRCKEILGFGNITGPYFRPRRKPNYRFVVYKQAQILQIIEWLFPYLSNKKRRQANKLKKEIT